MQFQLLTTKEAADYLRLGKPTLERFRTARAGPAYIKLGGAVRYLKTDLDRWIERNACLRSEPIGCKEDC
jgi:excisionase family DNA binding protein